MGSHLNGGVSTADLFVDTAILPDDPIGEDGRALDVLHDREYRVRAYRKSADLLLIRGAVRDQKPPGMIIDVDPDPLTIHHMQIDLDVSFPSFEIVAANVAINIHPNRECPNIVEHYDKLVGLSIARGFTHKVRELFGGPRGCTHTTMLLQAMAPVAHQCAFSMRMVQTRHSDGDGDGEPAAPQEFSPDMRRAMSMMNLNTCHVWAEDSDWVRRLEAGEAMVPPVWAEERMVSLGLKPDYWRRRMPG